MKRAIVGLVAILVWGPVAAATPAAPQKSLGLVPLRLIGATPAQAEVVQGKMRGTVSEFVGTARIDLKLGPRDRSDDVESLRRAAVLQQVDRIVGGHLLFSKDKGQLLLLAVDAAGGPPARLSETIDVSDEAVMLATLEGATCRVLGDFTEARGCQGTIQLEGPANTKFLLDGKVVPEAFESGSVPVAAGEHMAAAATAKATSQVRPVLVQLDKSVYLRAVERCGGLSLLAKGESPGCGDQDPVVIVMPGAPVKLNWAAIGVGAGAVALAATAGALAYQVSNGISDLNTRYAGSGLGPEDVNLAQGYRTKQNVAWGLAGGAAALAITSAVLFFKF